MNTVICIYEKFFDGDTREQPVTYSLRNERGFIVKKSLKLNYDLK